MGLCLVIYPLSGIMDKLASGAERAMRMTAIGKQTLYEWVVRGIVLLTAMPIHESAHAWMAFLLGDDTARRNGRLTMNPFRHLDLWGSLLLIFVGFGWAKPVPINPRKFKKPRRDMALSAAAGPLSNILMALVLMIVYKVISYTGDTPALRYTPWVLQLLDILLIMLTINLYLAVFNLLPIPPLDGAKLFGAVLPDRIYFTVMRYERYIMIALFILMFMGFLAPVLETLAGHLFSFLDQITQPIDRLLG